MSVMCGITVIFVVCVCWNEFLKQLLIVVWSLEGGNPKSSQESKILFWNRAFLVWDRGKKCWNHG